MANSANDLDQPANSIGEPLRDIWYLAAPSRTLKSGAQKRFYFLGEPVVVGRTEDGQAFALSDICAHRSAPLSGGRQLEEGGKACLECPYHGWRFDTQTGVCQKVPALSESQDFPTEKIRVPRYPIHEERGLIWIYIPADPKRFEGTPLAQPPRLPEGVPGNAPQLIITADAEGPYDEAVVGLVDPAHTPYVHQQWFWRRPDEALEKVKDYEPSHLGFRMKAHAPASNGRAYKLIGGAATTEILFELPGIRKEIIRNEKYTILGLTAITPMAEGQSLITQIFYWDMPLLSLIKPLTYPLAKRFLGQDGAILRQQNENLKHYRKPPLYVGDADKLAQWYMALKRAYLDGGEVNFTNPVPATTLRWQT